MRIVKKPAYNDRDTERVLRELDRKFEGDVDVTIRFVAKIPRTRLGKYQFLIQDLPLDRWGISEDEKEWRTESG